MTLDDYLSQPGAAGQQLAAALGVPPPLVSQWRTGARRAPAERCVQVEKATGGAVRCEDLRPDIDWAYLRATDCVSQTVGAGEVAA